MRSLISSLFILPVRHSVRFLSVSSKMNDISAMRAPYKEEASAFLEKHLVAKEPFAQFHAWFLEAKSNDRIVEPNAMCLSTATKDGIPSGRMVLCKGYSKEGFKFFTNYESRKGHELDDNPNAALNFYWDCMHRCVRIEGTVQKVNNEESDKYFYERPVSSQISASVSHQSSPISSRSSLVELEKKLEDQYSSKGLPVPRPEYWGGYLLLPKCIEFWQGQRSRLHDRIKFRRLGENEKVDGVLLHQGDDGWVYERLSP